MTISFRAALLVLCLASVAALAQPLATETGFVQVEDDVRLFYQRFGTGMPTVFVPNRLEFVRAFGPLLERFDVVTWDPRGRGLSSRPEDVARYGIDAEIADAEAMRRHFGAERVAYVGGSVWGSIAMLYAARHPERVERVVAMGPLAVSVDRMGPPDRPIEHDLTDLEAEIAAWEADGRSETDPYGYCVLVTRRGLVDSYVDLANMATIEANNFCQYENERPGRDVARNGMFASLGAWDWTEEVARIVAPVLVLYGDHEAWPLAGVRAYAEHGSTIGLLELVDSGHHVWNDANRRVVLALEAFLTGDWPAGTVR
jgi:pimeloyl-ACP methyl ester carboxylesterase